MNDLSRDGKMLAAAGQPSFSVERAAPVLVVGTGPAGMRCASEILRRAPKSHVAIFGAEPGTPYNRVRLTPLLAGEIREADLLTELPAAANLATHYNCRIVSIDPLARTVSDAAGHMHGYGAVVLATGSRPHIPGVPGIDLPGVFSFRDLHDVSRLIARSMRCRRAVVIGGGLLGLEAARGLGNWNIEVIVIEHAPRLMARQLDDAGAGLLAKHVRTTGIEVITGDGIRQIFGTMGVEGIRLASGREIFCDTVVVAAGIRPNVDLALAAGLSIGRGIRVDDRLCTSDPHIYAIGECAEHKGIVYGLAAPGIEQAGVVAHNLVAGVPRAIYAGSLAATKLKTVGLPVFSIGDIGDEENPAETRFVAHRTDGGYRKIALRGGYLVGAMAVGDWTEISRVQEAVVSRRRLWPWQIARFRRRGTLWPAPEGGIAAWPATATVCNCTGVTVGTLRAAMAGGLGTVAALAGHTGASTVCGSCRPLLIELVGADAAPEPAKGVWALLGVSGVAAVLALLIGLAGPWSVADTVQVAIPWDALWLDGTLKQVSGFSLLGLSALSLVMSMRKRWRVVKWGDFAWWRIVHVALGLATLAILVAHTGFRLGENLNRLLIVNFLLLALLGALAGGVLGAETRLAPATARRFRRASFWVHLMLAWPLPALLTFHVLSVYYF